jgi:(p)ppGpp synthase/HD superfamily hydrolase
MKKYIAISDLQGIWHKISLLHHGQTYTGHAKGQQLEYINHIGSVVFEVINAIQYTGQFDGELAVSCALLHDTLEDTDFTVEELTRLYGEQVAAGVLALTKNKALPKEQQIPDSLHRIRQQPKEIWAVKLADRISNLKPPPFDWDKAKKIKYLEDAALIHEQLKDGNEYLANRLAEKMGEYQQFIVE